MTTNTTPRPIFSSLMNPPHTYTLTHLQCEFISIYLSRSSSSYYMKNRKTTDSSRSFVYYSHTNRNNFIHLHSRQSLSTTYTHLIIARHPFPLNIIIKSGESLQNDSCFDLLSRIPISFVLCCVHVHSLFR